MTGQLLETKFFVPPRRRGVVARARLRDRLDRSTEVKLTVVAAPAGFGKTTLLADWLAASSLDRVSVAWLSLDRGDDDPSSFWTYVIAALRSVLPGAGADATALLKSSQSPSIETALDTRSIFNKLGVSSRRAAVRSAQELRLL